MPARPQPQPQPLPRTLIGCSPKSYFTAQAATEWLAAVSEGLQAAPGRGEGAFLCAPFPLISAAIRALAPSGAVVGAQDVSRYPRGAFTGEVSAELLAGLGARYAMVGHPERVRYFGEGPAGLAAKAAAAARFGLVPILIVGEQEEAADPAAAVRGQVAAALAQVPEAHPLILAYEPAWAIGQPEPAPAEHVVRAVAAVRGLLADRPGPLRVLYGGSARPGTFRMIARRAAVLSLPAGIPDGIFLGRAGVQAEGFLAAVAEVRAVTARPDAPREGGPA